MVDLSLLPKPQVIEDLNYETVLSRRTAKFKEIWKAVRVAFPDANLPTYDVEMLETDPAKILLEAGSYDEVLLRSRINDAARARLLAYAVGTDLDHLAAFYDVTRMSGETDDRLKLRVILAIQGRSTGGPKERYKSVVMGADLRVASVEPYRIGRSPVIHVALFSTEAGGVASSGLISTVKAALEDDGVRLANDEFVVTSAVQQTVSLSADVWLTPDADMATIPRAKAALLDAWKQERALGRDLVHQWWVSKLMIAGMHKVSPVSPTQDIIAAPYEAISISDVTLTLKGRAF